MRTGCYAEVSIRIAGLLTLITGSDLQAGCFEPDMEKEHE